MSIDEAIARERQEAKEQRDYIGTFDDEYSKMCEVWAEEAQQIAEWLEELKKLRQCTNIENREYPYFNGFKEGKQVGYNKAIDDAKSVILQTLDNEILVDTLHLRLEQLKEKYNE